MIAVVEALESEVGELKSAAQIRESAGLIEDYFKVNDADVEINADTNFTLVDPFCIEGPSVIEFTFSASFDKC